MRTIFNSDGMVLHFTNHKMYLEYEKERRQLDIKYYKKIRDQNGIWASNQNKFVSSKDDLNDWDSLYMESLVEK